MTTTQQISLADAAKCFDLIEGCTELGDSAIGWQHHLTTGIERLVGTGAGVFAMSRANGTPKVLLRRRMSRCATDWPNL